MCVRARARVCVCLIVCDLETSKRGGLGSSQLQHHRKTNGFKKYDRKTFYARNFNEIQDK